MKLLFLTFSLITFVVLATAQPKNIVIGTIDTIYSKILDEKRPIWIYTPDNLTIGSVNNKKYPVIYLLDGDWHFTSVVGMMQQLSYINGNTICPEMIVVGIPVKDRFRDMTPSYDSTYSKTSGGYNHFISFIRNELISYIESTYPVAPYKIFIGHSLGGLTVINTLINEPNLFNAYVAIDPSMWWDNQLTLKATEKTLYNTNFDKVDLYLAIANTMNSDMDTSNVKHDQTRSTLPIRSLLEFSDILNSTSTHNLNYQVKYYSSENHGSVPLIATYDALHFIFNFYNLPLTKKDYSDTTMSIAYRIENHYKNISDKMGYKINPSENLINTLGYNSLYLKNVKLAEYFFKLNVNNYPNSYNTYDSMGDYFKEMGDNKQAIIMYAKALSIQENPDTRKKLESLERK